MPNRTIYVTDADLPLFEKAQKLAGDNLSAAIAHALRSFVEKEEARQSGFEEITVKVGKGRPYLIQKFRGRPLAKRHISIQKGARLLTLTVYQTAKGRFALYAKTTPGWSGWPNKSGRWSRNPANDRWDWDWDWDWSLHDLASSYKDDEYRLDVFDTLDDLKESIPEELYEALVRYLQGEEVEFLDI
jgi:EXLDI family protein